MRQVDWNDLRLFLLFIRAGTTRAAGDLLGISHSTVARRLEQLGKTVGAPLYHRNSHGLQLTLAGQELLDTAKHVENEIIELDRRAFGKSRTIDGPVTLSIGDALSVEPFLSILAEFIRQHPKIELRLISSVSLSDLDRREADLALRFGSSPSEHLVGRKVIKTARAVYASHAYAQRIVSEEDRDGLGWISFSSDSATEAWKKSTPFASLPTVLRCADIRTQQIACRAGIGLVMLPCFLCDPDPKLCRISEPEFVPRQDLWLLKHSDMRENARVKALSDFLIAAISKLEPLLHGQTTETERDVKSVAFE